MGKFYGTIGYAITEETSPGVWKEQIVERNYFGDSLRNISRRYENSGGINDNIRISNDISILADAFAYENFSHMRYVEFMGAKWIIANVEVQRPRLILTLGGVYNG